MCKILTQFEIFSLISTNTSKIYREIFATKINLFTIYKYV